MDHPSIPIHLSLSLSLSLADARFSVPLVQCINNRWCHIDERAHYNDSGSVVSFCNIAFRVREIFASAIFKLIIPRVILVYFYYITLYHSNMNIIYYK